MTVIIDGGAGVTFPDTRQQTNATTNTGGNPQYYAARAWVNFNGTGTIAIRASVNVSSITDNGVGLYTVNYTSAMPDANYSILGTCAPDATSGRSPRTVHPLIFNTNSTRINTTDGVSEDQDFINVAVFR